MAKTTKTRGVIINPLDQLERFEERKQQMSKASKKQKLKRNGDKLINKRAFQEKNARLEREK